MYTGSKNCQIFKPAFMSKFFVLYLYTLLQLAVDKEVINKAGFAHENCNASNETVF